MVFQLHGEGFELPPGAVRLASSALYPNQAFRIGSRCWGFQFHVEIDRTMLLEWIREYWGDPAALAPDSYARIILKEADARLPELERMARSVATDILKIARGENPG
jgi:GMP synthase (glutamine-hydrolysing)